MLDDFDLESPEELPPEESGNRTFMLVAGGLGGFALISLICLGLVWYFRGGGGPATDVNATAAAINARNTEVAQAAEGTAAALALTPTVTQTLAPTATPSPTMEGMTVTPDGTVTGGPTVHPATATVRVLLTQAAIAQTQAAQDLLTVTPTATALPGTGIGDEIGLTGMLALASTLILVIVFARRLRAANS